MKVPVDLSLLQDVARSLPMSSGVRHRIMHVINDALIDQKARQHILAVPQGVDPKPFHETLMGLPVVEAPDLHTMFGTHGIFFADLSAYLIYKIVNHDDGTTFHISGLDILRGLNRWYETSPKSSVE